MFLRNFWELWRTATLLNPAANVDSNNLVATQTSMKAIDGTALGYVGAGGYSRYTTSGSYGGTGRPVGESYWHPFGNWTAVVGTGTSNPDASDYALESDTTSSFTGVTSSVNISVSESGRFVITLTWSGTNTSGSDITISEIGAKKLIYYSASSTINCTSTVSSKECLMIRHLLTTPITVSAGAGTNITVQIELY